MRKALFLLLVISIAFGQYVVTAPGGIVIELDTLDGFFGIGDTVGTPGRRLMYDFGYAWHRKASPFTVMIDSVLYSNDPAFSSICPGFHIRPYRGPISAFFDGFASQWSVPVDTLDGSVIITQRLRAVIIDEVPAVEISYTFLNIADAVHSVAFSQNIDVLVGTNDVAPFAIGGVYTDLGDIYTGNAVPYFWQAYERGPGAGADQIVARGLLRGVATKPDIFAFGHQPLLYMDCWEPGPAVIDRSYHDSGVTLLWHERPLSPHKSTTISTIYGLGPTPEDGTDYIVMPLIPNSLGSACDRWAQNPLELAIMVHNMSLLPGIDSLTVCISLDEGLSITFDPWHTLTDSCYTMSDPLLPDSTLMLNWLVSADSSYFTFGPTDATIIARITSPTEGFTDYDETTLVHIPDPGGIPPVVEVVRAPVHAVSCGGVNIHAKYLIQDDVGVDFTSLIFQIGPYLKYHTDTLISFVGDTAILTIPFNYLYHGHYIHTGVVAVSDFDGCIPDLIPVINSFWVDQHPPNIGSPYPPDGSLVGDSLVPVFLPLTDWPAGVDTSSIRLRVSIDGVHTTYSTDLAELEYRDSSIHFDYGGPWPDLAEIEICLTQAWDLVDPAFCPVNAVDTFCWSFSTDYANIGETDKPVVFDLSLHPNPFNSAVRIDAPLATSLEIFDISGRRVRDLTSALVPNGLSTVFWDGRDNSSAELASGIYFVRAISEDRTIVEKLVLLR
ncbi:MAG TPA: T9SS type A sorting domain-containing protein [candidate division Zixibacteria bacterium]|nr:T9SS type A sorting domain-containing protein [candidate division Zixibacteria bacterium]